MKGTLIVGPIQFARDDGQVVTIMGGAMHPNLNQEELSVMEYEWEEMWRRIREKASKKKS